MNIDTFMCVHIHPCTYGISTYVNPGARGCRGPHQGEPRQQGRDLGEAQADQGGGQVRDSEHSLVM